MPVPDRPTSPGAVEVHAPERAENVRVGRSKVHGRGLFARRSFEKGQRIMRYGGEKVPKKEGQRRTDEQWAKGRVYTFELNGRYDIDGDFRWNKARLANHSCDPNAESSNNGREIWIVARRPIRPGDEVTYDYNFPFEEPPAPCRCGTRRCSGYMVGSADRPKLRAWLRRKARESAQALHHAERRAKRIPEPRKGRPAKRGAKRRRRAPA